MAVVASVDGVRWNQLKLPEQIAMLAMTVEPQMGAEWTVQRSLCYHGIAEITPRGLKLTQGGRRVMAERHGLPVVVGIDRNEAADDSSSRGTR